MYKLFNVDSLARRAQGPFSFINQNGYRKTYVGYGGDSYDTIQADKWDSSDIESFSHLFYDFS